jgi:quercetin dioxygenase-like cupin family protein
MKLIHSREVGTASEERGATFTGTVWADSVLAGTDPAMINTVMFTPGARTHWHTHDIGQVLQVVNGRGFVQVRGGDGAVIEAGDTVWIPAGEEHWHGALPETFLTHTAISLGTTNWLDPVTDEDYQPAIAGA